MIEFLLFVMFMIVVYSIPILMLMRWNNEEVN